MSEIHRIPFKAIHRLRKWRQSTYASTFEDLWLDEVLLPGMEKHFKSKNPVIYVFEKTELGENSFYVDVHIELESVHGKKEQPWILTFICDKGIETQKEFSGSEVETVRLKTLDNPFPERDIFWECEYFDEQEVIDAMYKWSETFWPDFDPVFKFGMVGTNQFQWIKDILKDSSIQDLFKGDQELPSDIKQFMEADLFTIGSKEDIGKEVFEWLKSQECHAIKVENDEFAFLLTPEIKEELQEKWPDISFETAFDFEGDW